MDDHDEKEAGSTPAISRREALTGLAAALASTFLPFELGTAEAAQPNLAMFASTTSLRPGERIDFYVLTQAMAQSPVTLRIRLKGQGTALWTTAATVSPFTAPASSYATGCPVAVAASFTIPSNWSSGLYVADAVDNQGAATNVPFFVKGSTTSQAPILIVSSVATTAAYNRWGGGSLYESEYPIGGYIHSWDGITFSHQVSFDRPWIGWPNSFGWDFTDMLGLIAFLESAVGAANLHYATSIDLHSDPNLLSRYNLMVSVGHDEYWSKEMRDNVEAFTLNGGNVCFLGGNTCWWQVRFEKRDANGNLLLSQDNHSMVCYKMEGAPASVRTLHAYPYERDPMYAQNPARITTHWFVPEINRPENMMTGTSYRNGSYTGGWSAAQRSQLAYTVRFANHWAFKNTNLANGSTFANGQIGPETDAAVFSLVNGVPVATGVDGSPLNFTILATCEVPNGAVFPSTGTGWATMGLFRNTGVVFNAASLGWHYGLWGSGPDGSIGADAGMRQVTKNVLLRLKQRGPWKYEEELHNAYFEVWSTPSKPDNWIVEGLGTVRRGAPASATGNSALEVDARNGQMWITQDYYSLPPLWMEARTRYQVGVWVKADSIGSVAIYLRCVTSGRIFAVGRNTLVNQWEVVAAIDQNNNDGPVFGACVVMVINQGAQASLSDASVWEVATPAVFSNQPISR
jgi:N,N-dimethylformamidase beta subunit-like protein